MLYFFIFLLVWINLPKKWKKVITGLFTIRRNRKFPDLNIEKVCTDCDGNPLVDEFGELIVIPEDAPFPPSFSKKRKEVAIFRLDEFGNIDVITVKVSKILLD